MARTQLPRTIASPSIHSVSVPSAAAANPPALNKTITLMVLLRSLRRCWRIALPLGIVLAAISAVATWMLRPDKVTTYALIRIIPTSATHVLQDVSSRSDNEPGYMRTQLAILRSPPVLADAVHDQKIQKLPTILAQPDPVAWLDREAEHPTNRGDRTCAAFNDRAGDGSDLASILNTLVASYLATVDRMDHAAQFSQLKELQAICATAEEKVRLLRESLMARTRELKGADPQVLTAKQKASIEEYVTQRKEMTGIDAARRELEVKLSGYKLRLGSPEQKSASGGDAGATDVLIEQAIDADPLVQAQMGEVSKLREKLAICQKQVVDPNHFTVVQYRKDLDAASKESTTLREERRKKLATRYQTASRNDAEMVIKESQIKLDLYTKQRNEIESVVKDLKKDIDRMGVDFVELDLKRSEIDRSEIFVRAISEQKERLELELHGNQRQRVSILAAAQEAKVLNRTSRAQEAIGAGLAGLFAGLFIVSLWEARKGRIYQLTDVSQGLRLPVMGILPNLREIQRAVESANEKYGPGLAELVDSVRTRLLNTRFNNRCPVIMVTSASPGEGKTTLVTHLAASLARGGYRNTPRGLRPPLPKAPSCV